MRCVACRRWIPDWIGGDLSPADAEEVRAHVAACPDCASEFEEYRDAARALAALREPALPAGLMDGFWEELRDRCRAERPSVPVSRTSWWRVAALFVLGLGLGYLVTEMLPPASELPQLAEPIVVAERVPLPAHPDPVRPTFNLPILAAPAGTAPVGWIDTVQPASARVRRFTLEQSRPISPGEEALDF